MKEFDVLYKRTKTGAIQFWHITVQDADTQMDERAIIMKKSGQLGTDSPLIHREEIREGKQKRTYWEQAVKQAESDWKKKQDEGYKTYADVMVATTGGERFAYESVKDPQIIKDDLENCMPAFNTDASGELKPMLAPTKGWQKGNKKNKYPMYMEPKLDGVRVTIKIVGTDITILSRSGKPYTNLDHIRKAILRGIAKGAFLQVPGDVILDGEIYLHGLLLEEINEAVKKTNENTPNLQFWMFDVPTVNGNQQERTATMLSIVAEINEPDQICYTLHVEVNNDEEVEHYHNGWVEKGFEGGMIKDPNGTYQPGQRSSFWTKVKMFDDSEFAFKEWELGQRGTEDLIAVCTVDVNGTTEEFRAKMQGTRESKEKMYHRKDLAGKQLTVKHFGFSKYGIPNLPTGKAFRD